MQAEGTGTEKLTQVSTETKKTVKESTDKGRKTYAYEEALQATLEYFKGDELAATVWVNKYALKDSFGKLYERDPDHMHWRIASEIARIEQKYPNPLSVEEVYELLREFRYIVPQGSPMTGIGNHFQIASLSNCFVIGNFSFAFVSAPRYVSPLGLIHRITVVMSWSGSIGFGT